MRAISVVRFIPNFAAAPYGPPTTHADVSKVLKIIARSESQSVVLAGNPIIEATRFVRKRLGSTHSLESTTEFIRDVFYVLPHSAGKHFNIMFHQRTDIFDSLTQWRQRDGKYIQAIVEIAAKLVTLHH